MELQVISSNNEKLISIVDSTYIHEIIDNSFYFYKAYETNIFNNKTHQFLNIVRQIMTYYAEPLTKYLTLKGYCSKNSTKYIKIIKQIYFVKDTTNNLYFYNFYHRSYTKTIIKLFTHSSKTTINQWFAKHFSLFLDMLIEIAHTVQINSIDFENDTINDVISNIIKKYNVFQKQKNNSFYPIELFIRYSHDLNSKLSDNKKHILASYSLNDCKHLIDYLNKIQLNISSEKYDKLIGSENDMFKAEMLEQLFKQYNTLYDNVSEKNNELSINLNKQIEALKDTFNYDINEFNKQKDKLKKQCNDERNNLNNAFNAEKLKIKQQFIDLIQNDDNIDIIFY